MSDRATPKLGRVMATEIAEQPGVLERILTDGVAAIRDVATAIRNRAPRFVLLTARGTSDNAALYAKYLVEILLGLPAGLTSPSTTTVYGARPDLRDCLVIAVSQSGGSPDLVESTRVARECGALTLAVTNAADSPLNEVCELGLDVLAGLERATPATKTYTAQLLTLYLLLDRMHGGDGTRARELPDAAAVLLSRQGEVLEIARRYRFADRLVTTGRGYAYATAREAALKIMETSYVAAHAFSGADLLHGPLAMVDSEIPVVAVVPAGVGGRALYGVLDRLKDRSADVCVVGTAEAVTHGTVGFTLADGIAEEVSPIMDIIPLQLLAYEIAVGRGLDPDLPRALTKVTETH
jgi:glucosamine--fructose-6-phosphate aminotransferase (isomerizing)